MKAKIKLRRGAKASIPSLAAGEPAFTTDEGDIYVGSSSGNKRFPNASKVVSNVHYDSDTGEIRQTIDGTDYTVMDPASIATHEYPGAYSAYTTKNIRAAIARFTDGADNVPFKDLKLSLKPVQSLNGYDHPWPPGGGKNKLPLLSSLSAVKSANTGGSWNGNVCTINGLTFTCVFDDTGRLSTVSVNGTATAVTTFILADVEASTFAGMKLNGTPTGGSGTMEMQFQLKTSPYTGWAYAGKGADVTISASASGQSLLSIYIGNGASLSSLVFKPMLRLSTEADATFAPYSNICPISGYTGANIYDFNKNFVSSSIASASIDNTGKVINHSVYKLYVAPVKKGIQYTITTHDDTAIVYAFFNSVPAVGDTSYDGSRVVDTSSRTATAITAPMTGYIAFRALAAFENGQFELGNQSTAYIAHDGTTYSVSWADEAGTVYGGSLQYLGGGKWEITPTWASEDMGDMAWTYHSSSGIMYSTSLQGLKALGISNLLMPQYKVVNNPSWGDIANGEACGNSANETVYVHDTAYTDANAFKTAVAGSIMIFQLATPTTFTVTGPDPKTLEGLNYVFSDVSDVDLTYRVDPRKATGLFPMLVSSAAKRLASKSSFTENEPYLFRKAAKAALARDKIIGGSVAWNQFYNNTRYDTTDNYGLVFTKDNNFQWTINGTSTQASNKNIFHTSRFTLNHVYYYDVPTIENVLAVRLPWNTDTYKSRGMFKLSYINENLRYVFVAGATITNFVSKPQLFDLTQMFGRTIADYIYSLEQANAGAGVAFFRSLFPKDYYEYNPGELMSVKTSGRKITGKNLFDGELELGMYDQETGKPVAVTTVKRTVNAIKVWPSTGYYLLSSVFVRVFFYNANGAYISNAVVSGGSAFTTPSGARLLRFQCDPNIDLAQLGINCSATDHDYEPYEEYSYPLDSTLELRGIPKLDSSNKLYYDGDSYAADGSVKRKYGIAHVDSSMNFVWTSGDTYAWFLAPIAGSAQDVTAVVASKYFQYVGLGQNTENTIWTRYGQIHIHPGSDIAPSGQTAAGLAEFKEWLKTNPFDIVYVLNSPATESAQPFEENQIVDSNGTEEYIDEREVAIPVGHETEYHSDLGDKIEAIPDPPSANGTYTLKVTVSGGIPTYSWT